MRMSFGVGPVRFYSGGGRKRSSPPTPPSVAVGIVAGVIVGVLSHSFIAFLVVFAVVSIGLWAAMKGS